MGGGGLSLATGVPGGALVPRAGMIACLAISE